MKERPILFNGPMVRAILEGRKTQTRRVVKLTEDGKFICRRDPRYITACEIKDGIGPWWHPHAGHPGEPLPLERIHAASPYGEPGDRLWVRETWAKGFKHIFYRANQHDDFGSEIINLETGERTPLIWKPSIHMPRWASRITLEVTGIRVERLQEISEEDAKGEGFGIDTEFCKSPPRVDFSHTWEKLYGLQSWIDNPWVWAVEFKRC
jgi:hypothetical protein